jgi:mycothiol synthase
MRVRAPTWDDLGEVLELVSAADTAVVGESEWTEDSLRSEWRELDLERGAWVVELQDRIGAYAAFEDRGGGRLIVEGYVHPDLRGRGLGSKLIEVTEEHARGRIALHPAGERVYLQSAVLVGDECTPNLFSRRGYAPAQYQFRMVAELEAEPRVPAVTGVEIRPYREPEERRAVHAVLEDAFAFGRDDFRRRSFEEWAPRVFEREEFDPTLVRVAVGAGGNIVGASVCGWKEWGDWGWVGTLGVSPAERGRGIGDALLRTAFAEFWRRGERRVALGVGAENASATRLYERAGMRVAHTLVLYEKELRSAG